MHRRQSSSLPLVCCLGPWSLWAANTTRQSDTAAACRMRTAHASLRTVAPNSTPADWLPHMARGQSLGVARATPRNPMNDPIHIQTPSLATLPEAPTTHASCAPSREAHGQWRGGRLSLNALLVAHAAVVFCSRARVHSPASHRPEHDPSSSATPSAHTHPIPCAPTPRVGLGPPR